MKKTIDQIQKLFANAYAVIWDMDGVLVDTETYHFQAHRQALSEFGVGLSEHYYKENGVSTDPLMFYKKAFTDAHKEFTDALFLQVHYRKLALYQQMQKDHGIKLFDPAVRIARHLYEHGVLMAVASVVDREEVIRNLKGTELIEYFPIIVAGGDFGLPKKPEPDIYLKAVELLNVPATECIAIEDSRSGAQSAIAAKIPCLVVPNSFTSSQSFPDEAIMTDLSSLETALSHDHG